MCFWDTVMSPSAVQLPPFTDASPPQCADGPQAVDAIDHVEEGSQITTKITSVGDNSTSYPFAEPLPTAADGDIEMVDAEVPAVEFATVIPETENTPRRSRFAHLGLNARPLKFVGWKEPSPGLSVHTPIYAEAPNTPSSHQPADPKYPSQDTDDLDELEAMMVPAPLRQAYRERLDILYDPQPEIIKTSKFTTALITESGVIAIDNPNNEARITHDIIDNAMSVMPLVDEFAGYDDLPGVLAKQAQPTQPINKAELDAAMAELAREEETPYLDAKYFDLDSYLEHSQGAKGKKVPDEANAAPVSAQTPATVPRTGVDAPTLAKRTRKLLPKLAVVTEQQEDDLPGEKVPSPPKTPRGSDNEKPHAKPKDKYELRNKAVPSEHANHSRSPLSSRKWHPIEDNFMLLFHKKVLSVVERGHNIRAPGPTPLMGAFNNFFVGKIIDPDLPACEPRGEPSIKGKLQMATGDIKATRDATRGHLEGKKGGSLYVPVITQQELEAFMADGTVQADDPNDETQNDAKSPKRKREVKDDAGVEGKRVKQ